MEPAGLVLAVFGTLDLCLKYGQELMKRYRHYKNAEGEVYLLLLRIEGSWIKTQHHIEFIREIWSAMPEDLQIHLGDVLQVLQNKLQAISTSFEKVLRVEKGFGGENQIVKQGDSGLPQIKKFKFAILMRDHLESTVKSIEQWQGLFDPSWFLLLRIRDPKVDHQLDTDQASQHSSLDSLKTLRDELSSLSGAGKEGGTIFIANLFQSSETISIPYSQVRIGVVPSDGSQVLIDRIKCSSRTPVTTTMSDVRDLARVLSRVDPSTFGLLSCRGVVKDFDADAKPTGFDFVFNVPKHLNNPRSLRSLLLSPPQGISLNDRFSLVALLARSVFFMHTSRFVHKNVRPENIVIFEDGAQALGRPFLVGFEKFRLDTTKTSRLGDALWERDLYRHPERQGKQPEQDFTMQHDIYSLGVVLLEVGLNFSFVLPPTETSTNQKSTPNPELDIAQYLDSKDTHRKARSIKKRVVKLAKEKLPGTMGLRYTQAAITCLACLDPENEAFGDKSDLVDNDGILVGVRFIEKVLTILDEIVV